jgi:hypothetical protein
LPDALGDLRTVDSFPVIPGFRSAKAGHRSRSTPDRRLDRPFPERRNLPGLRGALQEAGTITRTGARGEAKSTSTGSIAGWLRPFTLPPGLAVSTWRCRGDHTRVAHRRRLLAAMSSSCCSIIEPGPWISMAIVTDPALDTRGWFVRIILCGHA